MKAFPSRSVRSILIVCALAAVLVLLAWLQFGWANEVAQAERERMEASLETSVVRFRWDFYTQLLHVCSAFRLEQKGSSKSILQAYANRYDDWTHASTRPRLVAGLLVWKEQNRAGHRLFRLNPGTGKFEPGAWPSNFDILRLHLRHDPARFFQVRSPVERSRRWSIVERVPALVHALPAQSPGGAGYLMVALDRRYMETDLFPLLAGRYFRGPTGFVNYRVSIVSRDSPAKVLYQSSPSVGADKDYPPDATVDLIPVRHLDLLESPFPGNLVEQSDLNAGAKVLSLAEARPESNGVAPVIFLAGPNSNWELVVRHRSGSVQAAVIALRRRDLAVSLGILAILAGSVGLIILSAQRAQRLARVEMDFVAGISHELRTPLAVIRSAADNLADGVVEGPDQVQRYGALIRNEGRRLTEMVEQTLGFAARQASRPAVERLPVRITDIIDAALTQASSVVDPANLHVEKRLAPDLPYVSADGPALTRCVQNLLVNAVKYGGDRPRVRISAHGIQARKKREVEITIEDEGIGIEASDIPHIFEPFYRGRSGKIAQIHGTGLGLSLAKDIAEAMGGSIAVKSEPGKGSLFSIRLPALAPLAGADPSEPVAVGERLHGPSAEV